MSESEVTNSNNLEVYVKTEVNQEDSLDTSSNQDEMDSYQEPGSIKSDELDEHSDDRVDDEMDNDDEDEEDEGLDDMEGTVIHFLAEKSIRKTKVKSGIKSACRFKCDNCTSIFRYKSTLNYHLKSECGRKVIKGKALVEKQPQGKVSCNICGKTLCSRTSLMVHMRIHTGERPFVCPECGRSFFQKAHLVDHQNKMHTAAYVLCRLCNSTFQDKYHLNLHMKEHKQIVAPFNCKLCDESFSSRTSLTNHLTGRHGEDVKSGKDPSEGGVEVQKRTRHPINPDQTECPECGRTYSGPRQLRAHFRRAHRAYIPCPHCPRLFPSSYDLRVHSRCHTGERPYSCEFCERTFSRKSILDVHRTLHTGQKDFVCSICSKAFNRKSKLQVHFTEHTNQTVKCEVCQKEFKCRSYLTSHMKIHSEDHGTKAPEVKPPPKKKKKRSVPALTPLKAPKTRSSSSKKDLKEEPVESEEDEEIMPKPMIEPKVEIKEETSTVTDSVVTDGGSSCSPPYQARCVTPEIIEVSPEIKVEPFDDDLQNDELPLDCSVKTD